MHSLAASLRDTSQHPCKRTAFICRCGPKGYFSVAVSKICIIFILSIILPFRVRKSRTKKKKVLDRVCKLKYIRVNSNDAKGTEVFWSHMIYCNITGLVRFGTNH